MLLFGGQRQDAVQSALPRVMPNASRKVFHEFVNTIASLIVIGFKRDSAQSLTGYFYLLGCGKIH